MHSLFDDAVAAHGETVWRVCAAVLTDGADAEDAWSETFVSLLRAWPDLPDSTNVEAWLVRVARRRAVDIVRSRRAVPMDRISELPRRADSADTVVVLDDEMWDAVAGLPDRQREAVAFHVVAGLRHTDTAELTGSTPAAVRRAYADGLRALRLTVADPASPDPAPPAPEGTTR